MKQKAMILLAVLLAIAFIAVYCRPIDEPPITVTVTPFVVTATHTSVPTPMPSPSHTPTVTFASTPQPTVTNTFEPTSTPFSTNTPVPTPTLLPSFYVVQAGDNLSWISEGMCGYQAWRWLYHPNRNAIDDPNLIFRGQQLRIPWPCRK